MRAGCGLPVAEIRYHSWSNKEREEVHSIRNIRVLTREKKYYCGIPVMEYLCSAVEEEMEYLFKLYYYLEECKWKIAWLKEL